MTNNNRREFLKTSILGLSGAALIPGTLQSAPTLHQSVPSPEIPIRTLGKTGLKIPVLSMGTGDTNNPALVKAAIENGVILFGTSTYYGNGNNETMLGGVFKGRPRDSYLVATSSMPKGTDHQNGVFTDTTAGSAFRNDIEGSMTRLGVDYLDILFLPFAAKRESVFFEPLLRVMEDFKKSGKARFIAIASHSYVDEALQAAVDTKIYDAAMIAYNFRMEKMDALQKVMDHAGAAGMGLIAMKTMAGGYWDASRTQPINARAALKWVVNNKNIHTLMSGMTSFDQLQANLTMIKETGLTDEELKYLKLAGTNNPEGLYCLQCRSCTGQCPYGVDIPTLMRSYMYAYGYKNLEHARHTLNMVDVSGISCERCDECRVSCKAGFQVKSRIRDIVRLKDVPLDFLQG
jgi:predicted aldo/keto reductase-like oxidoreductase